MRHYGVKLLAERFFTHQGSCDAAVRRHVWVVRKQRIRIGVARHHKDIPDPHAAHPKSDAWRWRDRQTVPAAHSRVWRHVARRGLPNDGETVRIALNWGTNF